MVAYAPLAARPYARWQGCQAGLSLWALTKSALWGGAAICPGGAGFGGTGGGGGGGGLEQLACPFVREVPTSPSLPHRFSPATAASPSPAPEVCFIFLPTRPPLFRVAACALHGMCLCAESFDEQSFAMCPSGSHSPPGQCALAHPADVPFRTTSGLTHHAAAATALNAVPRFSRGDPQARLPPGTCHRQAAACPCRISAYARARGSAG